MKIRLFFLFYVTFYSYPYYAKTQPSLEKDDQIRLSEAFQIATQYRTKLWKQWNQIPMATLLITETHEFLLKHPQPSNDFQLIGYNAKLKTNIYYRKRIFSPHFLASFPFNGIPTIVMGQPKNTGLTSTEWVLIFIHEHFHQLQFSQPNYSESALQLGLSKGDKTGMWMLNYPFPYQNDSLSNSIKALSLKLLQAYQYIGSNKEKCKIYFQQYKILKKQLKVKLTKDDYAYFLFQTWQEGIERYSGLKIAEMAKNYQPSAEFQTLADYLPFPKIYEKKITHLTKELEQNNLKTNKRVVFYSIGATEGFILDYLKPQWKEKYFKYMFNLDILFDE